VQRLAGACIVLFACARGNDARTVIDAPLDVAIVDAKPDAMIDACIPVPEKCDGKDSDCDGKVDEDFPNLGMTCGVGTGACAAAGHYQCTADGTGTECSVQAGTPMPETCNNLDDDCDGMTDEDFPNKNQPCSVGVGACVASGHYECSANGATTQCSATAGTPTAEKCNNIDDDCDGSTDEDWPIGQACSVGLGACARTGMLVCNAAQTNVQCSATPGAPTPEICGNGIDEDCDGADAVCPPNDLPGGAIDISAGGTWTVDLSAAHDDNWAASTSTLDCGDMGGRDVFYTFTLPAEEVVYFDSFGSNFDSVIRIFPGACTAIGGALACADDACASTRSQGAIDLAAGQYCLVLDQFSSATTAGNATLHFLRGGRTGVPLPNLSGSYSGTTSGGVNQSIAGCQANSARPDVGHFFLTCPSTTYTVDADTCLTSWDTILYLRSGKATSADVACNDSVPGCGPNGWAAELTGVSVSGANLQWLIVDGFGQTGEGPYTLRYTIH
jgi:hypothetical protein